MKKPPTAKALCGHGCHDWVLAKAGRAYLGFECGWCGVRKMCGTGATEVDEDADFVDRRPTYKCEGDSARMARGEVSI